MCGVVSHVSNSMFSLPPRLLMLFVPPYPCCSLRMVLSVRSFRFPVCVVGRGAFCHAFYLDSSVETLVVPSLRTLEELRAVRCFRLPCRG